MPSYSTNDPKGWCGNPARGAALGRASIHAADKTLPVRLYLRRVSLDSGGYDKNGTYFGKGTPLYWVADSEGEVDFIIRAVNRNTAKSIVMDTYPQARFFR